jgi:hypothetical protein
MDFDGVFPALKAILKRAFAAVEDGTSSVTLTGVKERSLSQLTLLDESAFHSFKGTVTIDGTFDSLDTIGASCFSVANKVLFSGVFPVLTTILSRAFNMVEDGTSSVTLTGVKDGSLSKLTTLDQAAFTRFTGTVTIEGTFDSLSTIGASCFLFANVVLFSGVFPALEAIPPRAFAGVRGVTSSVTLKGVKEESLSRLTTLDERAFEDFKGTVTIEDTFDSLATIGATCFGTANVVVFDGVFPALKAINGNAFEGVTDVASSVKLTGVAGAGKSLSKLTKLDAFTFSGFKGTVEIGGTFDSVDMIDTSCFASANKVDFSGVFPVLEAIKDTAFANVVDVTSTIVFAGLPEFTSLGTDAFLKSVGVLTVTGCYPAFEPVCAGVPVDDDATKKFVDAHAAAADCTCPVPDEAAEPATTGSASARDLSAPEWVGIGAATLVVGSSIAAWVADRVRDRRRRMAALDISI